MTGNPKALSCSLSPLDRPITSVRNVKEPDRFVFTTADSAIEEIRTGKYAAIVDPVTAIYKAEGKSQAYTDRKSKLPAWSFSGTFKDRVINDNLVSHSGLIIADIDALPDGVTLEQLRKDLTRDTYTAAVWVSPSGAGLKVLHFLDGELKDDADHKRAFETIQVYHAEVYGVEIDDSGKDVRRLCFVGHDPDLYVNPDATAFVVPDAPPPPKKPKPRLTIHHQHRDKARAYGQAKLDMACDRIATVSPGAMHNTRRNMATLVGGYVAGGMLDEHEALVALEAAALGNTKEDPPRKALKAIRDGFRYGLADPISWEEVLQGQREHMQRMDPKPQAQEAQPEQGQREEETDKQPEPLRRAIGEQAPYPVDKLPSILKNAVYSLHQGVKAPLPLCAQSILAAAALAVQGHANAIVDGRVYPLSEYFITIAESGERKSAVDEQALYAHSERQKELKEEYSTQEKEYYVQLDAWKKSREVALTGKDKTNEDRLKALQELGPEPEPPIGFVLKTDEATFQGLFSLLKEGQPSIGLFSDEGGRLLGGYSMNSENIMQMVAGLSNLWDGRPITRTTGGNGTTVLYGRRLSTHLMVQEQVASTLLCNAMVRDQGLLSRCLITFPQTAIGTREYSQIDLSADEHMKEYWAALKVILQKPKRCMENTRNELDLPKIPLSSNAKKIWIEFHNHIEKQMGSGGPLEGVRDYGSKLPEHAVRIAGILALVEDINSGEIGEDAILAGIALAQFYLEEAIRIRSGLEPDAELELAQKALNFLHKKWMPRYGKYLCLVPLYQEGPPEIRTAKKAKEVIRILEAHGWLVKQDEPKKVSGKIRNDVWEIRNG